METPIQFIKDVSDVIGSVYFEFLPGEYQGKCWNTGSVYLAEEVFTLLEPVMERHIPAFDHYSFVRVSNRQVLSVCDELELLKNKLLDAQAIGNIRSDIGFMFTTTESEFARDFASNRDSLIRVINELTIWLKSTCIEHECITILGI